MATDATVSDTTGAGELRCPFGAGLAAAPGGRPRPKRGYLVPGIIALVVCAAMATVIEFGGLRSHTPPSLAGHDVEALVSQRLQATHPQGSPPQVRCPAVEPLRAGLSFDCVFLEGGRPAGTIRVTELSAAGTLHVSSPSR